MENRRNIPKPEMTSEGKFRCSQDSQEYDNRNDYETHCMEEHMNQQGSGEMNKGTDNMRGGEMSGEMGSEINDESSDNTGDSMSSDMGGNESEENSDEM